MGIYSSRSLGRFSRMGAGEWQYDPGWDDTTTPIAPSAPPAPAPVDPATGIPYYLERPGYVATGTPLPSWVIPTAVGAGAFVLLGGVGLVLGRRRRKRR